MLSVKTTSVPARRVADEPKTIGHCDAARQTRRIVTLAAGLLFLLLLVRTAWISDASYITFRTVDNVLHGYGLRWNIANRVQAYTSPLWMLMMVVASAATGEVYYTALVLSIVLTVAVVIIIGLRLSPTAEAATLAFSALVLSKSFIEYSTSGLENALTHLLLTIYLAIWFSAWKDASSPPNRTHTASLIAVAGLVMVNRLDIGLLILPTLAATIWAAGPARIWPTVIAGLLPLVAWELVAIVYYGFPLPNVAYARLAAGFPRRDVLYQGVLYLFDALSTDPLTIIAIAAAMLTPLIATGVTLLPAGIGAYIGYIVLIGGDFMSGRFLSAPFLCAVVHLLRAMPRRAGTEWAGVIAVICVAGFLPGRPSNFSNAQYGSGVANTQPSGHTRVHDDRRDYYPQTGLLTAHRGVMMPNHPDLYIGYLARRNGERVHRTDTAGFVGYGAGPQVYVLDRWGVGDPLIARLPADGPAGTRHRARPVPDGYDETLESGRNMIRDPGVAAFSERLRIITEGPIWSVRRWRTIVAMNLGRYNQLLADYGKVRVQLDDLAAPKPNGTGWNQPGNVVLTERGAEIALSRPATGGRVEVSVSGNDTYSFAFMSVDKKVGEARVVQPITPDGSLLTHIVAAPSQSYDKIIVKASAGDGLYSLGHVRLMSN